MAIIPPHPRSTSHSSYPTSSGEASAIVTRHWMKASEFVTPLPTKTMVSTWTFPAVRNHFCDISYSAPCCTLLLCHSTLSPGTSLCHLASDHHTWSCSPILPLHQTNSHCPGALPPLPSQEYEWYVKLNFMLSKLRIQPSNIFSALLHCRMPWTRLSKLMLGINSHQSMIASSIAGVGWSSILS